VPRRAEFEEMEQIQVVRRSMEPQQKLDASTIESLLTCVTSSRCRSRRQSPSSQSRVFASRHPSMCRLACLDLRDPSMIEQACRDPQQKLGALAIGVLHNYLTHESSAFSPGFFSFELTQFALYISSKLTRNRSDIVCA
jgi:hypothetical protein